MTSHVVIRPAPAYEHPSSPIEPDPGSSARSGPARDLRIPRPAVCSEQTVIQARRFATQAMTVVLEVMDRRRGTTHLDPVAATQVRAQVEAISRSRHAPGRRADATPGAAVRRVHIQMRGPAAAEVFGSYARGPRVLAFAMRIEKVPCRVRTRVPERPGVGSMRTEYRWRMVALNLA